MVLIAVAPAAAQYVDPDTCWIAEYACQQARKARDDRVAAKEKSRQHARCTASRLSNSAVGRTTDSQASYQRLKLVIQVRDVDQQAFTGGSAGHQRVPASGYPPSMRHRAGGYSTDLFSSGKTLPTLVST
jgi:hypothetical protein